MKKDKLKTQYSTPEFRFQYNGKEKTETHRLMWNNHGARNLDLQLGRWWSLDPIAEKYAGFSPFVSMGNNPMKFVDLDGRSIRVANVAGHDLNQKYINTLQNSFDGKVTVAINNGYVSMTVNQDAVLNGYEQAAFDELTAVIDNNLEVTHTLYDETVIGHTWVAIGRFEDGALDLDDIALHGNNNNEMTAKGKFVHEAVEQFEKAKMISEGKSVEKNENEAAYQNAHKKAVKAENKTSKFKRKVGDSGKNSDTNPLPNGNDVYGVGNINGGTKKQEYSVRYLFRGSQNTRQFDTIKYEKK